MSTTTRPTPVLTEAQRHELWTLFCEYGRLREYQGQSFGTHHPDHADRRAEADAAQMRFGELLASLTVYGAEAVSGDG